MAYLTQPDYVKYVCSCGQLKPITSLYFCRHCLKIRCGFCICHEVDSHYCANCLENMPSSEARLKKNRCTSCFDCPSCFHTLSTRATLAHPKHVDPNAGGDTKVENKQPKKMYYLSCFNCRWTSRDVGIPDQPVASGGWPERSAPFAARVSALLDHYKAVALHDKQEKLDRERKKFNIRGKYITLTDKTGLTSAMARNLAGMPASEASTNSAQFTPATASETVPGLPEDAFTADVHLTQITTMPQRLAAPESQPVSVSRLHPLAKLLSVKRSQRCRQCDHNLTKPEYNPGSIKFKIELLAFYHVPEVKLISVEPLKPGCAASLLLKITNPTAHDMTLTIAADDVIAEDKDTEALDTSIEKTLLLDKEPSAPLIESRTPLVTNCVITAPNVPLALAQRDDAAEYDDDLPHEATDYIIWRKSNKLAVRVEVTPSPEAVPSSIATATLTVHYSYRNTVPPAAGASSKRDHTLCARMVINLGTIAEN